MFQLDLIPNPHHKKGVYTNGINEPKFYSQIEKSKISKFLKNIYQHNGRSKLLKEISSQYDVTQLQPRLWQYYGKPLINKKKKRKVILKECHKTDLSSQKVVMKGREFSYNGERRIETLDSELKKLITFRNSKISVEKPIGFFKRGLEEYIFTEFVEGPHMDKALETSNQNERYKIWESDAKLFAQLSNINYFHPHFDTSFDDKIYSNEEITLIDVDETFNFTKGTIWKLYGKKKENIPEIIFQLLKDTIYGYTLSKNMKKEEIPIYLESFARHTNVKFNLEEFLEKLPINNPKHLTLASYIGMMNDC